MGLDWHEKYNLIGYVRKLSALTKYLCHYNTKTIEDIIYTKK